LKEHKKPTDYVEFISLGGEIAGGILLPILIGYWLDNYFGSRPWLLLVGCLVGIVNVFILIFQLSKRLNKK
jgi:ATP synthase protein I